MPEWPHNLPVCWWTPGGYQSGEAPAPFLAACRSQETDRDWAGDMRANGYQRVDGTGSETSSYDLTIWRHDGDGSAAQHLLVELWDTNSQIAALGVAWDHAAAFHCEGWPALLRNRRTVDEPSLLKAVAAFIRHGHGEQVIDQWGSENLEERQERREAHARWRAEWEAAKKTPAGSPPS